MRKAPKQLSSEEVKEVFELKAGRKMTNVLLAKKFGVSDTTIARTLKREIYTDVPIPEDLVKSAEKHTIKRNRKAKPAKACGNEDKARAMNLLTTACFNLLDAEEACIDAGLPKEKVEQHIMLMTDNSHL